MQVTNLAIDNFLAIRHIDMATPEPVQLFAGNNEQGKSSLQEAIRYALTGETLRVPLKKDYLQMITDGASAGMVTVGLLADSNSVPGKVSRNVKDGKVTADSMIPDFPALPFVMDAQRFSRLTLIERRTFLQGLLQMKANPEEIRKRLAEKITSEDKITLIMVMLKAGFPSAHTEAKEKATAHRADWKAITGEVYGEVKANTWEANRPFFNETAYIKSQDALTAAKLAKNDLLAQRGQAQERLNQQVPAATAELEATAATFAAANDALKQAEQAVIEQQATIQGIKDEINNAAHALECPACKAQLVREGNVLRTPNDGDNTLTTRQMENRKKKLETEEEVLFKLNENVKAASTLFNAADTAALALQNIRNTKPKNEANLPPLDEINDAIATCENKLQELEQSVRDQKNAKDASENADRKTNDAKEHHRQVAQWTEIAAMLAPDGIPGTLLAEGLKPLNDRLLHSSQLTGWAQVTVGPDMQVRQGTRLYGLHSESAQWRIDAMLAEAIAHLSGLKLMILDRIDVLDINNRLRLVGWANKIKDEYDTIMLLGTLKELPKNMPNGFAAHWLQAGEVLEEKMAAAS
jgi:hypothetical protein